MHDAATASENRWSALLRITRSWRLEWQADQLLERVAREAVEFLGLEGGVVWLVGREGLSEGARWPADETRGNEAAYSRAVAEQVVHGGRAVFAHDVGREEGAAAGALRLVYCVPLTASRGVLGALYLDSQSEKGLTRQDQEFLEMLGLQAAAALEHALLYHSAITDPLTGLFSHRHFQQEVEQAVRRAQRTGQPLSLAILDLDHFKALNDSCGHEEGNRCLVQVAEVLRDALRATDIIARFGGDEFEVLLPDTRPEDAVNVAEKIRARVAALRFKDNRSATGAIGVAAYPAHTIDGQGLFLRADEALYEAKQRNRNCVVLSQALAPKAPKPESRRRHRTIQSAAASTMMRAIETRNTRTSGRLGRVVAEDLKKQADEQVDGHRVLRRLGSGSSGEVLLVRQPDLDRVVALKRPLTPHLTEDQADAFEREARLTASLEHPGVVTVHTMGTDLDGRRYYTMKPLKGQSLQQILEARRRGEVQPLRGYTRNRLLEIVQRAAETIAYAHQQEAVHLDLTPSNILVGEFGEVTIIDWGSGASHSSLRHLSPGAFKPSPAATLGEGKRRTRVPLMAGSPAYLAPEHLPGAVARPGPATDVHSLGSILYEVLTDRPPYLRETTRETLGAVQRGDIVPPEKLLPEAGIDPSLSALCLGALAADPTRRIGAAEFAERLGRYVRREQDWEIVRFGDGGRPLVAEEWSTLKGEWALKDGEWVSAGLGDGILIWRVATPGAYRFVCEGWVEASGELSLIGSGAPPDAPQGREVDGYFFQFGSDFQTGTKLARHGHDVMAVPELAPEPGKRHRLEIAYEEGWLTCFLDGKRVFTYRELFPMLGRHIGLYAYGKGAHFRPLELHRQNWGLQVPAIRVADDLFQHQSYEAARVRYEQLAELCAHRLEGDEAQLKIGICLARTEQFEAARAQFRRLRGSALEPFALAEEAKMEIRHPYETASCVRGASLFRQLLERFPGSQARFEVLGCAHLAIGTKPFRERAPLEETMAWLLELNRVGRKTLLPPAKSQLDCHALIVRYLEELGRYDEAFQEDLDYRRRAGNLQARYPQFEELYYRSILNVGRDDLLPPAGTLPKLFPRALIAHLLVRRGGLDTFLEAPLEMPPPDMVDLTLRRPDYPLGRMCAFLAAGRKDEAHRLWLHEIATKYAKGGTVFLKTMEAVVSARDEAWLNEGLERLRADPSQNERSVQIMALYLRSRLALEGGDWEGPARELSGTPYLHSVRFRNPPTLLFQVLLHTAGILEKPGRVELEQHVPQRMCGTFLDLTRMALGHKPPEPGALWPHPGFQPEPWLWLALWLEKRGEKEQARKIAVRIRDPRYGLLNFQPAVELLLNRLS